MFAQKDCKLEKTAYVSDRSHLRLTNWLGGLLLCETDAEDAFKQVTCSTRRSVEHWTRANGTWLSKLTE